MCVRVCGSFGIIPLSQGHSFTDASLFLPHSWIPIRKDYVNQYCTTIDSSFDPLVSRHNTNYFFPAARRGGLG